ncbi:ATP-binding protein [Phytoactinopolyspora endophytica]|uniref:ATP-binding protein n=1 Tax=Phytoactinopolyspora endophytica TaxID=1642495 RepID=UPI00101B7284|nr:tetratricopeptide repeat protein [Phytoactinopolyspora endophytica]
MTAATTFGARLRELRLAAGLTQEALADRAGISARAVSDLERDPLRTPRLDTVRLLADALALTTQRRAELLALAQPTTPAGSLLVRAPITEALTTLIGREDEIAALVKLLADGETQLISLTGPGGVGKTRLAVHVAASLSSQYADGAMFVDLAPLRDPGLVLPAIAQQLGLDENPAVPVAQRLTAALRGRQLLILLDNAEHLLEARTELLALLSACPDVIALVTTRVPLDVRGERQYRIAPLLLPAPGENMPGGSASEVLFRDRALAVGIDLPPSAGAAVADICRRLDGLPLALELAAARTRVLPPDALLARLEQRLTVLVGGPHDLPDRQRTMRDAIAWSYQLLSDRARVLFRTLSAFAGGCPLPAAEAINYDLGVLDALTELIDASLVAVEPNAQAPRITMLETVRDFGLESSVSVGDASSIVRRHAEYFAALAEQDPVAAGEAERDNLRAAMNWALDETDAATALRIVAAMWRFWIERGQLTEGFHYAHAGFGLASSVNVAPPVRLAALAGAARLALATTAVEEASRWCDDLVELGRTHGTPADLVAALNVRAQFARDQDRYVDARRDYEEAETLATSHEDEHGRAKALIGLAYVTFFAGDSLRAEDLANRGLAAARQCGDQRELADVLLLLAWQAMHAGKYPDSHRLASEAVALYRGMKHTGGVALGLRQLGTAAAFTGEFDQATVYYEEARELFLARGEDQIAGELLAHLGHVALNTGDIPRARKLNARSLESARAYGDQWALAMAATQLGHVELADGQLDAARDLFTESADLFEAIGNPLYVAWCLEGVAGVAAADGRWDQAAQACAARQAVLAEIGHTLPPVHPESYQRLLAAVDRASN